ncbi:MAG: hypothetical protein HYT30_01085 [Parcubacteria group bacterium]|nr:hypothetical protein [Parcubacteria group bacterium]
MFDFFIDVIVATFLEGVFRLLGITDEMRKMKISNYVAWGTIAFAIVGLALLFISATRY